MFSLRANHNGWLRPQLRYIYTAIGYIVLFQHKQLVVCKKRTDIFVCTSQQYSFDQKSNCSSLTTTKNRILDRTDANNNKKGRRGFQIDNKQEVFLCHSDPVQVWHICRPSFDPPKVNCYNGKNRYHCDLDFI